MGPLGDFRPDKSGDDTATHHQGYGDAAPFVIGHIGGGKTERIAGDRIGAEKQDGDQIQKERSLKNRNRRHQCARRPHKSAEDKPRLAAEPAHDEGEWNGQGSRRLPLQGLWQSRQRVIGCERQTDQRRDRQHDTGGGIEDRLAQRQQSDIPLHLERRIRISHRCSGLGFAE